jgi:hypothetical protein
MTPEEKRSAETLWAVVCGVIAGLVIATLVFLRLRPKPVPLPEARPWKEIGFHAGAQASATKGTPPATHSPAA